MDSPTRFGLAPGSLRLSVVIPAFNEAARLPGTLDSVTRYLSGRHYRAEVIVADDGSTDGTAESLRDVPSRGVRVRILQLEHRGKGAAIRDGMLAARGRYVLFMDADNSSRITEIERMLPAAEAGARVVIGSRYVEKGSVKLRQPWYRVVVSRVGNRMIRATVLPGIKDTQCGFKVFEGGVARELAARLTRTGYGFDIELLVLARRLGYEVVELPVSWYDAAGTRIRPVRSSIQTLRELAWIRAHYANELDLSVPPEPVPVPLELTPTTHKSA
jgi:dolichyl-phosphate beta-glucosyltransferase